MDEQRHIVNKYRPLKPKRTIGLSLSATHPLRFTVDSFLYSARRTQDALGRYIAKAFDMQLSTSFRGLIKSLDKYNLPKSLTDVLTNYWQSHGEQLRQYRDIADKHTIVSDHVFLFGGDDGSFRIRMLLLSNPEAKETRGPYTFGRPEVHAQRFLCDQFQHLLATCYRVTKALLQALPGEREARFGVYPRGAGPGSDAEGCQPLSAQELESTVEEMVTEIRHLPVPRFEIESSA